MLVVSSCLLLMKIGPLLVILVMVRVKLFYAHLLACAIMLQCFGCLALVYAKTKLVRLCELMHRNVRVGLFLMMKLLCDVCCRQLGRWLRLLRGLSMILGCMISAPTLLKTALIVCLIFVPSSLHNLRLLSGFRATFALQIGDDESIGRVGYRSRVAIAEIMVQSGVILCRTWVSARVREGVQ